ncbi:glycohydrolase toxin TNT-related protein [Rummeliibacillus sp. JY-2-4R]
MKLLYEEEKWIKIANALENVNEVHKYDSKYGKADDLFDDSKSEIASKDVDGAIHFNPQKYETDATPIRQDYKKLYDYAKGIGKVIDEKVDEPFYKSIDSYIQKMADLNISSYSTANTINVEEGFIFKHDKEKITINDLFETDTTYSKNLKTEFEAWKLQNQDQDISEKDYRLAALNTGAFEYEGIRAGQEKKEFWFNIVAAGLVIGLTIVCPPAGLVAGGIYTAIDVGGAIKGEDLISGRKLSDDERIMRGVFALAPAAGGLGVRSVLKNVPALAKVLTKAAGTLDDAVKPIKNTVDNITTKTKQTAASAIQNAKHLGSQHVNKLQYMLKHPVVAAVTSKSGEATIRKSAKFIDEALRPVHVRTVQTTTGDTIGTGIERGENKGTFSKKADDFIAKMQAEKELYSESEKGLSYNAKELLKQSTCKPEELYKYLKNIDEDLAEDYLKFGKWTEEIQIPKDSNVLQPNGRIDWSVVPQDGFTLDKNGNVIKEPYIPYIGEIIDRYGPTDGRFTSPVNGKPYPYDQRSLPYIEDPAKYHQYEIIGDFGNIKHYYDNCLDMEIKNDIDDYMNYWDLSFESLTIQKGEIAPAIKFNSNGGGIQYQLPLPIKMLQSLGLIKMI